MAAVIPAEIEDLVSGHPEVVEATALGVEDKEWGHRLRCFVVKVEGSSIDEDTIKTYVRENLARYKVILAGISALILTVGLARFAYTPLLPIMRDGAGLSDVAGGWLATINYLGYMSGALLASCIGRLSVKFMLYRVCLVLAVVTTLGMGLTDNVVLWAALRFVAGVSSIAGLLLASGLVLNWLTRHHHRQELGLHFTGLGLGIVVSGLALASMIEWTNWAVVKIPAQRRFLLRTYSDLAWRDVDLSKIDFAKAHAPRPLYDGLGTHRSFLPPALVTQNSLKHNITPSAPSRPIRRPSPRRTRPRAGRSRSARRSRRRRAPSRTCPLGARARLPCSTVLGAESAPARHP